MLGNDHHGRSLAGKAARQTAGFGIGETDAEGQTRLEPHHPPDSPKTAGSRLLSPPPAGHIQRHGRTDQCPQSILVDRIALVEVDGAPGVAVEA